MVKKVKSGLARLMHGKKQIILIFTFLFLCGILPFLIYLVLLLLRTGIERTYFIHSMILAGLTCLGYFIALMRFSRCPYCRQYISWLLTAKNCPYCGETLEEDNLEGSNVDLKK